MRDEHFNQEIAAGALLPVVVALLAAKVDPETLPTLDELREFGRRLSWRRLLEILETAETVLSQEQLTQIGAQGLRSPFYRRRTTFACRYLTLEDAFRYLVHPHRHTDFYCLKSAVRTAPGSIEVVAILEEGYRPSATFFTIMMGAASHLMKLFGVEDATITSEASERHFSVHLQYSLDGNHPGPIRRKLSGLICNILLALRRDNSYGELVARTFALKDLVAEREGARDANVIANLAHERRMANVAEVIVEYDELNNVSYVSPNAEKLFGYSERDLVSDPLCVLSSELRTVAKRLLEQGQQPDDGVYRIEGVHKNGDHLNLEISVRNYTESNRRHYWLAVIRDVAESVRTQSDPQTVPPAELTNLVPLRPRVSASVSAASILVVDDNASAREVCSRILEQAGYKVHCAADGSEVTQLLSDIDIDGLLLDANMPTSGEETFEAVRTGHPSLPVLFVTGDAERVQQRYPNSVVVKKPYRAEVLVESVRDALLAS